MAVFTEVSFDEAAAFLGPLQLGPLRQLQGITGGIENTNYFVDTAQGAYVLTVFERLSFAQLPFYLHLMKHLAHKGIPVPDPAPNSQGEILHRLKGKPAAVVNRLPGRSQLAPQSAHCAAVGDMLARMHLAGRDYPQQQNNLRGLAWWNETVPLVLPFLTETQRTLLQGELAYQNQVFASSGYASLPAGPVHADLFRDNVMFDGVQLTGFFDFYFAACDTFLFDMAVCLNDWCIDLSTGAEDAERTQAFMSAYQNVRALTASECDLLPALQRAAALRFWISRLWDFYLPRAAQLLQAHDPSHFERVLRQRQAQAFSLR